MNELWMNELWVNYIFQFKHNVGTHYLT